MNISLIEEELELLMNDLQYEEWHGELKIIYDDLLSSYIDGPTARNLIDCLIGLG